MEDKTLVDVIHVVLDLLYASNILNSVNIRKFVLSYKHVTNNKRTAIEITLNKYINKMSWMKQTIKFSSIRWLFNSLITFTSLTEPLSVLQAHKTKRYQILLRQNRP